MYKFPTLFSRSKTGKVKVWEISVDGSIITVLHGYEGGKMTETSSPPCKGKNLGKANETTPEEQAMSEAKSKWNKQIDKDYKENLDDCGKSTLPPLAKKYQDLSNINVKEYAYSTKLNGVRMTAFLKDGKPFFQSRGGKAYPVIEEVAEELQRLFWDYSECFVVDGELYSHGMHLEDITSAVKKHNENTSNITFYVFDLFTTTHPDQLFRERSEFLLEHFNALNIEGGTHRVELVRQFAIDSEEELIKLHAEEVKDGYEGSVLRRWDSLWKWNERSSDFLKYKISLDEEFKCVNILIDKNGGGIPVFEILFEDGSTKTFKANFKGTHSRRKELWENKEDFIGKYFTVEFESWSKYGVPLKPISVAVREMVDGKPQS